jgi:hypothetical protein
MFFFFDCRPNEISGDKNMTLMILIQLYGFDQSQGESKKTSSKKTGNIYVLQYHSAQNRTTNDFCQNGQKT